MGRTHRFGNSQYSILHNVSNRQIIYLFIEFPTSSDDIDKIAEIYARELITIRTTIGSQQPISSIIILIAEYCCSYMTTNPSAADTFWPQFFKRCTTFVYITFLRCLTVFGFGGKNLYCFFFREKKV